MINKPNRPHDLYKELHSYAVATFVLYFLIMCLVICVIVSCACLTSQSILAQANYDNAATAEAQAYWNSVIYSCIDGIAAACGVCIFFILAFEICALVINIIGVVKATQIPLENPHRSPIFVMEIVTIVLSFFIGLLAWIPAAVLVAFTSKAKKDNNQPTANLEPVNNQII